jgi:hypothetical protein
VTTRARCLYCGTSRPVEELRCPQCGHPWIDRTVAEAVAPPTPARAVTPAGAPAAKVQLVSKRRWVFPVAITAAAVAVYAIVFFILLDRTGREDPPVAAPTTTQTEPEPTTAPQPSTTVTEPTTTAAPTTTTTAAPTTTTTTEPPLPEIPVLGDPIPLDELTLGAFALGPLEFGDADTSALGRLAATFGQPNDIVEIGEAEGLCPTETGRAVRFGWLTAIVREEAGTEVLVAYRLEAPTDAGDDHPTASLKTISGAAIGDTLPRWESIYRSFTVRTIDIDGEPHLLLLRTADERTLLWGPLTDDNPALVAGIYSPSPCDGGPFG